MSIEKPTTDNQFSFFQAQKTFSNINLPLEVISVHSSFNRVWHTICPYQFLHFGHVDRTRLDGESVPDLGHQNHSRRLFGSEQIPW